MLSKFNLLSVNQLAAQIKLVEIWKSTHVEGYPICLEAYNPAKENFSQNLRDRPTRIFNDSARLQVAEFSFCVDAARVWNQAPCQIHNSGTLSAAKKEILKFVKTLPV